VLKYSFLIALIIITASCSNKKNENISVETIAIPDLAVQNLESIDSIKLSDSVHRYFQWKLIEDNTIVAVPFLGQNILHTYSYPDFKVLDRYFQRGKGPGEFIGGMWANSMDPSEFILYDLGHKKLYTYGVEDQKVIQKETFDIYLDTAEGNRFITKPFPFIQRIDEKHFLMKTLLRHDAYLETADLTTGKVLSRHLMVPQEEQTDEHFNYDKYNTKTVANDIHVLMYYPEMERLDFFEINKDKSITLLASYGTTEPPVENDDIDFMFYLDVQIVGDDAFALKLIQEEKGNPIGSAIEHYKMDGTPVAKYVFDRAVSLAHVDLKLKKIFAYEQQMEKDQIVVYDLP
jgi:hypothetical protein